jgi:hypothetical protein
MQALKLLREHLLSGLKIKSDDLLTFVESGTVFTVPALGNTAANSDFQLKYQAVIYVLGSPLDARYICWLIGEWMNIYQLAHTEGDIQFEADILSHDEVDLEFRINLREDVIVKYGEDGLKLTSCFDGLEDTPALDIVIVEK